MPVGNLPRGRAAHATRNPGPVDNYTRSAAVAWVTSTPDTWNPSDKGASATLGNDNTSMSTASALAAVRSTGGYVIGGTVAFTYLYFSNAFVTAGDSVSIGFGDSSATLADYLGSDAHGLGYLSSNGKYVINAGQVSFGNSYTAKDTVLAIMHLPTGKMFFAKNGIFQGSGNPATLVNGISAFALGTTIFPMISSAGAGGNTAISTQFGLYR